MSETLHARDVRSRFIHPDGLFINIRANPFFGFYISYISIPYSHPIFPFYKDFILHNGINEEFHRSNSKGPFVIIGTYYNLFNDASDLNEFSFNPHFDHDFDNIYPFVSSYNPTIWTLKSVLNDTIHHINLTLSKIS